MAYLSAQIECFGLRLLSLAHKKLLCRDIEPICRPRSVRMPQRRMSVSPIRLMLGL